MVFCGPHLPLAFQFVLRPGGAGGAANKLEGKWKVSLCFVALPHAGAGCSTNSSFCWKTTFEDICAVRKVEVGFWHFRRRAEKPIKKPAFS